MQLRDAVFSESVCLESITMRMMATVIAAHVESMPVTGTVLRALR